MPADRQARADATAASNGGCSSSAMACTAGVVPVGWWWSAHAAWPVMERVLGLCDCCCLHPSCHATQGWTGSLGPAVSGLAELATHQHAMSESESAGLALRHCMQQQRVLHTAMLCCGVHSAYTVPKGRCGRVTVGVLHIGRCEG